MERQGGILGGEYGDPEAAVCEAPPEAPLLYTPNPGATAPPPLPPAPSFEVKPYQGRAALTAAFGQMEVADGKIMRVRMPGGAIFTGSMWESRYMTLLKNLPLVPGGRLYVNKVIEAPLRWLLDQWAAEGGYQIEQFGCFAPRAKVTNPSAVSLHSLGIAFDLNPAKNPLSPANDPQRVITDIPERWFAIARLGGWTCGRDFQGRKDPMHFQFAAGV